MAPSRKRKHAASDLEEQHASKQPASTATQRGIKTFAAVCKTDARPDSGVKAKKRKSVREEEYQLSRGKENEPSPSASVVGAAQKLPSAGKSSHPMKDAQKSEVTAGLERGADVQADKKRKRRSLESVAEESEEEAPNAQSKAAIGIFKQFAKKPASATPRTKRVKSALPPSPVETPSKNAAALFSNLHLSAAAQPIPFSLSGKQQPGIDTPPSTPDADKGVPDTSLNADYNLPSELQNLSHLHSAFLSALSMHYAHNGTASPVYVQALLPQITKTWRRRTVTIEDVRRVLSLSPQPASFILEDYGRAGVCLSRTQPRGRALKRAASYVDEEELNQCFDTALQQQWNEWQMRADDNSSADGAAVFIAQLPLATITAHASAEKAAPFFARGAQRLADMKSAAQSVSHTTASVPTPSPSVSTEQRQTRPAATASRGSSLLDRVLARQALASGLPSAPTKAQLERRAALHRAEDIARVLSLLAGGKARCSFSLPAVVQHLQQSLRNPITREEVERSLEVMTEEVTPGFVNVILSGNVKGVVISKGQMTGREELRERVERALMA